jgi:hypothetical protein
MLESQFVFGRPPNPYRAFEVSKMHAALPERGPCVPEGRPALAAEDRAPTDACQALGQQTGATHGLLAIAVDQERAASPVKIPVGDQADLGIGI